ncbi:MAG: histidine utilization repressor [Rhodospirillaceae bacterium]|nr:histidine utilization repressor [Rhodospirillaceae bacterium]
MSPAASQAPATLHQQIKADIENRILSGDWRPGHRIPYEHELMRRYKCARMTVNKAIAALVDAGLVVRRRKVGSFVAQPVIQSAVLGIPDIQAEIIARGESYGLKLLSRRIRSPRGEPPEEKILAGKGILLDLKCLHSANNVPFALERRLISLATVPDAATADFTSTPPGTWLLGHVPWTEAQHRITAINADAAIATDLQIKEHDACLVLERWTSRGDEKITFVRQIFPGVTYSLIADFTPKGM